MVTRRSAPTKPDKVRKVSAEDQFVRMVLYGDPGTHKTFFAASDPKSLILEADRGLETAAFSGSTAEYWSMADWGDMEEAKDYIRNGGYKNHSWVWLDSITGWQERGVDDIMTDLITVQNKTHRKKWSADKGDIGANMSRISLWLRELREAPINIGITAHVMREEDEDGEITYMPSVQGKGMPAKVCGYVGVVARALREEKDGSETFRLTTRGDNKFYTKDRFRIGTIVNPTIPKMMRIVEATRSGQPRPTRRSATKRASS